MSSWDPGLKMQQSFIDFIGCQVVNRFNIHQSGFQLPPIPPKNPPQWLQTSSRGTLLIKVFSRMLIPIVVKLTVHWNRRITTCETPGSFEQFACHKGGWACFRSQPCGWFRNLGWKRESYLPSLSCKCQQMFFSRTHIWFGLLHPYKTLDQHVQLRNSQSQSSPMFQLSWLPQHEQWWNNVVAFHYTACLIGILIHNGLYILYITSIYIIG